MAGLGGLLGDTYSPIFATSHHKLLPEKIGAIGWVERCNRSPPTPSIYIVRVDSQAEFRPPALFDTSFSRIAALPALVEDALGPPLSRYGEALGRLAQYTGPAGR